MKHIVIPEKKIANPDVVVFSAETLPKRFILEKGKPVEKERDYNLIVATNFGPKAKTLASKVLSKEQLENLHDIVEVLAESVIDAQGLEVQEAPDEE